VVDKVDDLIILTLMFLMSCVFASFGHWQEAKDIALAFMGAAGMYLKGQS